MREKRIYTAEEVEVLAEKASKNAMDHFKEGFTCSECVLQGVLELGISDLPVNVVALSSGFGGGMGETFHTCGAVTGGLMAIGSVIGRQNPKEKDSFEERVAQLHDPETGIYPIHGKFVKKILKEKGSIECRDMRIIYDETTPEGTKERARMCKRVIGLCAKNAVRAALTNDYLHAPDPDEVE